MVRRLTAVAAGLGVMLVGALAHAQTDGGSFGNQGEFIFSANRLFPVIGYSRESQDQAGQLPPGVNKISNSEDSSGIGFFWGGSPGYSVDLGNGSAATLPNVFTVPRLGFDYTIIPNVTIGGDIVAFFTLGGSQSSEVDNNSGGKQTTSVSEPKSTIFGIAPRGGYILRLTDMFALWLRGGVSFYTASVKQTVDANNNQVTTSVNFNQFALDLDPQLVITPIPHFGFTAGLTADIPIAGGHSVSVDQPNSSTSVSAGSSLMFIGVTGGIIGWFGG